MKTLKIVGMGLLLVLMPVLSYATVAEIWSAAENMQCPRITTPTSTATIAFSARSQRLAWGVNNNHATFDVFFATYAVTSAQITANTASCYKISPTKEYKQEINPYTKDIYIICPSGTTTIFGEERWR